MNEVKGENANNLISGGADNEADTAGNVLQFSKTSGVLSDVANEKFDSGDDFAAVSFCLESEKTGKLTPALYVKMATAYMNAGLYSESADCWYKYLNLVTERHFVNAYNGLGGAFFLSGRKDLAGFYFNLQIQNAFDRELPCDDYMYELFYDGDADPGEDITHPYIKLVDTEKDEQKQLIETAKKTFDKNPHLADSLLSLIPETSVYYGETCVYRAIGALLASDYDLAVEMFETACKFEKQRTYSLNSLLGVYFLVGDDDNFNRVLCLLKSENRAEFENLFKFAALFGELKKYEKAYEFTQIMLELMPLNANVFYVHAFSAFNVEKFEESSDYFYRYYSLTGKYYAAYYRKLAEKAQKSSRKTKKKLTVSYVLPDDAVEKIAENVNEYFSLSQSALKRKIDKVIETAEAALATAHFELQASACQAVALAGGVKAEKFFKKKLVCLEVSDNVKLLLITLLVQLGNDKLTGAVFSGVYSRLQFERADFRGEKSAFFSEAYSLAFGRLAPICDDELYKIKTTAYDFYYKLCRNGGVKKINDVVALATAIAIESGCDSGLSREQYIEYFSAKKENVNKISELLKKD